MHAAMRGVSFALLLAITGCGDDGKTIVPAADAAPPDAMIPVDAAIPDARIANLDCNGDALVDTAADPVNVTGSAQTINLNGASPVEGATVEVRAFADPDGTPLGTATSEANGDYAIQLVTGAAPIDGFLHATADGLLPTEIWPPSPLVEDAAPPALMFDMMTLGLLAQFTGQSQDLDNNGIAVVLLVDCDQTPIEGAVLVPPADVGGVVYAGPDGLPDTSRDTTSTAGAVFVFDVPPGDDVVFDAEVMGMSLRDNHVRIVAGTVTALAIEPGANP